MDRPAAHLFRGGQRGLRVRQLPPHEGQLVASRLLRGRRLCRRGLGPPLRLRTTHSRGCAEGLRRSKGSGGDPP